jgi:hypothetical protein
VKAAVASYVQEVKLLANQLENLIRERDKLRLDIQVHFISNYKYGWIFIESLLRDLHNYYSLA